MVKLPFIVLILSFIITLKAADYLIDASSDFAEFCGVSPLIIGLTIVAFGTSAPEAAVNITASIQNKSDISMGNILGSNIMNIGIVVSLTAIFFTIKSEWAAIRIDIPFAFISSTLLYLLILDDLSREDGLVLGIIFFIYLNYLWLTSKESHKNNRGRRQRSINIRSTLFFLLIGLVGIASGGYLIVESSVKIAEFLGLSEAFIGLTLVSFGTSLPELITCFVACSRENDSIAIGNLIGSNIFNIIFVLAISSIISPIMFSEKLVLDLAIMNIMTLLLFVFAYTHKKISRAEGFLLIFIYILYFAVIFLRN
ncbi:MAG: calcium/sodium antiporter [Eubacteriales bacterium]